MSEFPIIPDGLDPNTRSYLQRFIKSLVSQMSRKLDTERPSASVLLASPNGSVYTVRVDDSGTLSTTLVYDAS